MSEIIFNPGNVELTFTVSPQTVAFNLASMQPTVDAKIVQPVVAFQVGHQQLNFQVGYAAGVVGPGAGIVRLLAGEAISRLQVVKSVGGEGFVADGTVAGDADLVVGIATATVALGEMLDIQVSGELIDAGWNWTSGPLYVGPGGLLTQNEALCTGFLQIIARAHAPTRIDVDPEIPLVREP